MILDKALNVLGRHNEEFPQIYPQPGWVEHDPNAIWGSVVTSVTQALKNADVEADELACIGITNQRETAVVWDRVSGEPIHNAIVWQCRRTADRCAEIIEAGHEELIRARTGLVVDAILLAQRRLGFLTMSTAVERAPSEVSWRLAR